MIIKTQNVSQPIIKKLQIPDQISLAQACNFSQKSGWCLQKVGELKAEAQCYK